MADALFNITTHLYNASTPPTAIQLYGGPILGTIVSITVYENDEDETTGVLPKFSPLASIVASPTRFAQLCAAINSGSTCTLCITHELISGRRQVIDISVQVPVLLSIKQEVTRTANTTHDIYEVMSGRLEQILCEVARTNQILAERLNPRESLIPRAMTSADGSTPPPSNDENSEERRTDA